MIIAIDPGPIESAVVRWDGFKIHDQRNAICNEDLLLALATYRNPSSLVIEMVACYGMPVGATVFDTCVWIGRFSQVWMDNKGELPKLVKRRDVKLHLCGQMKAKDGNVIQALKDRFGERGTKNAPGLTYGLAGDGWQAFALAVTQFDHQSTCLP